MPKQQHIHTIKKLLQGKAPESFVSEVITQIKPTILVKATALPDLQIDNDFQEETTSFSTPSKSFFNKIIDIFSTSYKPEKELNNHHKIPEDNITIAGSKFGGIPDLPEDFQWPYFKNNPLAFLAQINLDNINSLDSEELLPKTGLLSFFYDEIGFPWGFDPKDFGGWKVFYFSNTDNLRRYKDFQNIKKSHKDFKEFYPCLLKFFLQPSLPPLEAIQATKYLNESQEEYYLELREKFYGSEVLNKLLGYSHAIQNEDMEEECEMVSRGIYLGNSEAYKNPQIDQIKENAKDWVLLFQLDSDPAPKMMWGDSGRLYFWIKKQDLKNQIFDWVWLILQCY